MGQNTYGDQCKQPGDSAEDILWLCRRCDCHMIAWFADKAIRTDDFNQQWIN